MSSHRRHAAAMLLAGAAMAGAALTAPAPAADAQTILSVDATAPVPAPETGYLKLGSNAAPDGTRLGINSRYLTINDRPWMPVMGEIHFVRLPHDEWDAALARIKASGVDVVATYFFWNYHEETPGQFDWTGDRDARRFVEAAARHGLKVVLRLGPWSHGEVRYGGLPDWVVRQLPTRGSDPAYMALVDRYWGEIAAQMKGLMWKDGGPVIGIQLENEYNLTGPGQGRGHIADLKALALKHGFDTPFYTVTGWDNAVYPRREVTPVFGGYPDEPWGVTADKLPPKETYAFRFDSRVSGNLGAQTQARAGGDADPDIPHTPFLGAEYAGGLPTMYRRRPIVAPDDIAAMLPVQIGSGVNLYGYYMYHGGRNLIGGTTLEEATRVGGYNDLPFVDYDFQAPFGEYGEPSPVADRLRPFHYFLDSYGAQLAPMTVRRPAITPRGLDDLTTPRFSVRAKDDAAFLFVSNHVRQYAMAPQRDVRFSIALPGGAVTFPSRPITVATDAYFVWPVGMDLGGVTLRYASAQPVTRLATPEGAVHVFAAAPGIAPEFAFAAGTRVTGGRVRPSTDMLVVDGVTPGTGAVLTVTGPSGRPVRLLVLTAEQARHLWKTGAGGSERLILTDDEFTGEGAGLSFVSRDDARFAFSAFPALAAGVRADRPLRQARDGLFTRYTATAPARTIRATVAQVRAPGAVPPVRLGGPAGVAVAPFPEVQAAAGRWTITLPADALASVDDAVLDIRWTGDIGRLFAGTTLIDDRFYDGRDWRVRLGRFRDRIAQPLTLTVLPLRGDAPIYLDAAARPAIPPTGQIATIAAVTVEPHYRLTVGLR